MTMTDPIADMLTRIRNALMVSKQSVDIPCAKLKICIAEVLKSEGYIRNFKLILNNQHRFLRIYLRYDEKGVSVIGGLKRVSKPSCRVYKKCEDIPKVLNGLGVNIISTSKGLMTDRQARNFGIGGEIICSLW
ncbi:MAG: 30S ribosomal protein S8 [Deltaproteobacteria bacterium]|nr:30S ribosomal protein S8 [Deltaproteobacteria bacterium]